MEAWEERKETWEENKVGLCLVGKKNVRKEERKDDHFQSNA